MLTDFEMPSREFMISEIDDKLIDKLSVLAALKFEAEEKEIIKKDLKNIISFLDKISEIDTSGIEPLKYLNQPVFSYREDTAKKALDKEKAFLNATNQEKGYFMSPKMADFS
ncbi:MAG: Asp-tRNA(Asn)/Glu-tRNA(Gln) amidotransferase subunit GatC [Bacteroidetes bacterium]|jgi:aspartyl-tRNA(Asn)/glutamyl-tRNA(Gln) amidotransferase subunit C|nr:Asp-tRNA(Asn)/Glu-tRNA(Gln) amidotransferase subunit GatC [Bacteroidota bacterium]MBT6687097.1 Asp-tRNA(Asn)/Glu-tRNA(Gln) amidotransferase subunit GatC [Bacteroidota bacterium]MBT7144488.1 Asp-tRNA(Asn)/Glu-tRNA(Gln) amidotransferase subunit GatC [Bacteroidota bacterium]MBT7490799.1 Asp-tRNA(Asn)/Glu-tRNA(Gln) amidotransferase subunit GatC [Bacteroidota bacterium]